MNEALAMHKALRVSAQVLAWVGQQPEGRVHSVFARACNLAWGDHLISLTMPEYGMVPGGVAVALTGEGGWGFLPGEPVFWDAAGQRLLGTRTGVDLAGAPLWANRCRVGSVALTVIAGPLNYIGLNPKVGCSTPEPSK